MKATTVFEYGGVSYKLEIEESDDIQTLHKIIAISSIKNKPCYLFEKGDVTYRLISNKDKEGNTYINAEARGKLNGSWKTARAKFGQYKTKGYFWHDWEIVEFGNKDQSVATESVDSEEIPF